MPRMPGALWTGEHSPRVRMERYDGMCVHTIVGLAPAHAAHFSTFADGDIFQSRDTRFQSAANLQGNPRIIAVENEDRSSAFRAWDTRDGHAVPAMTDEQVKANAEIFKWLHETHGIPLQLGANSRPTSRGLFYHRQGIDGNFLAEGYRFPGRVKGGEIWTKSPGKVCPGDLRIAQLPEILRLAQGKDWFDMATQEELKNALRELIPEIAQEVLNSRVDDAPEEVSVRKALRRASDAAQIIKTS